MIRGAVILGVGLLTGCTITPIWQETEYVHFSQAEDAGEESFLEASIKLTTGEMTIRPSDLSQLYALELDYDENAVRPEVDFKRRDNGAVLDFALAGETRSIGSLGGTHLQLRLNPNVPLQLDTRTGVGRSQIDLSGMSVTSVSLQTGVSKSRVVMLEPNQSLCEELDVSAGVGSLEMVGLGNFGFRRFEFNGGVGETTLDFSGEWETVGDVEVDVGVGGISLRIPRDVGAEIRISRGFFSNYDLPGFIRKGDTYLSENRDHVDKVIQFRIRSGIGRIRIQWI